MSDRIAQLRIELQELEPKIWRRIDMPTPRRWNIQERSTGSSRKLLDEGALHFPAAVVGQLFHGPVDGVTFGDVLGWGMVEGPGEEPGRTGQGTAPEGPRRPGDRERAPVQCRRLGVSSGVGRYQPHLPGAPRRLGPVARAQLGEQLAEVIAHAVLA